MFSQLRPDPTQNLIMRTLFKIFTLQIGQIGPALLDSPVPIQNMKLTNIVKDSMGLTVWELLVLLAWVCMWMLLRGEWTLLTLPSTCGCV